MDGYLGQLLIVDLTTGTLSDEPLDPAIARDFVGGAGYAARYLYDRIPPGTDPLGPENVLIFMTGPLVGTGAPSCGRFEVCALSPLTGIWGESNSGGFWGPELRFAGYDGVVVHGRAKQPTWLSIVCGQPPALHDASDLWGLDSYQTQDYLRAALDDPKVRVASIGPAGENLVLYAAVMNDHGRAAGRTGMGAVMGSKNLKAIAVRGKRRRMPLADPDAFSAAARAARQVVLDDITTQVYREMGTASFVDMSMMWGNMPNKYWSQPEFEEATALSGVSMLETILTRPVPCYGCAVACGREVSLADTPYGVEVVDGPEYETVAMLGSQLLIDDLPAVAYAGHLCNRYGLDTISAGSVIALAYLLYDRGILTAADTGGLPLRWGDAEAAHILIEQIAYRRGLGDALAEGTQRLAARYGADDLAVHVNKLEPAAHDPRALSGMALVYATSPRGACHMQGDMYNVDMGLTIPEAGLEPSGRFRSRGKARTVANLQDWRTLFNSAIMCVFVNPTAPLLADLLSAATGHPGDVAHWQRAGERAFTLKRAFNNRLGIRRGHDRLPERLMLPMANGSEGRRPRMDILLPEYYRCRDWDWDTGKPTPHKLDSLGLHDVTADLWDLGAG
ncbi:MAG TPA: aldehyde ferredoxin oxidoreductase family protein [Anaerolineae bacterium]|nr:aldehyde ferredoxin oxidoreductase family protein [Anaerolineae bacterium]